MPPPKKIILHIGIAKTGSTSIQRSLRRKVSEIQRHGYLYPSCDVKFPNGHKYRENHSKHLFLLFAQDPERFGEFSALNLKNRALWRAKAGMRESLIVEIQNPDVENIIFSSEALHQLREEELQDLKHFFATQLPGCEFEILLFCRHPMEHAASSYQQNSKFFGNKSPMNVWAYSSILTRFANVFGKDAISIYRFEEARERKESIARLFFEKIGLPGDMIEDNDIVNASLSQAALDLFIHINSRYPMMVGEWKDKNFVTRRSWGRIAEDIRPLISMPGTKFTMDASQFPKLMDKLRHESSWLKKNYGISYELSEPEQLEKDVRVQPDTIRYVEEQLSKLNPFVRKLTYEHFNEMSRDGAMPRDNRDAVVDLLRKIRSRHPIMTRTPTRILGLKEEIKIRLRTLV